MIKIAQSKFKDKRVEFICADVMEYDLCEGYDSVVIYNAFPHFTQPDRLIEILSGKLKPGGRITVHMA